MKLFNRVLMVHNYYQQQGGEDQVVAAESAILSKRGHQLEFYTRHNDEIVGPLKFQVALTSLWSMRSRSEFDALVRQFRPDIIHVHNTFPLISPSIFWAPALSGIPVVQTLHNFRLLCPQAMFLRQNIPCEDCMGRIPWRGVVRACYRNSVAQSAVSAAVIEGHRMVRTYHRRVSRFIALSDFSRRKFIEGGIPGSRIDVKPNFVDAPPTSSVSNRRDFIFVGRLSSEKGVQVLADAVLTGVGARTVVFGSGPEARRLQGSSSIQLVGHVAESVILEALQSALALILPSICYENFPRSLVEAFACGTPVIASRLGAMAELVRDGETGLLFEPGSASDLNRTLRWAASHPHQMRQMGFAARAEYDARYTAEVNYEMLMAVYERAQKERPH